MIRYAFDVELTIDTMIEKIFSVLNDVEVLEQTVNKMVLAVSKKELENENLNYELVHNKFKKVEVNGNTFYGLNSGNYVLAIVAYETD